MKASNLVCPSCGTLTAFTPNVSLAKTIISATATAEQFYYYPVYFEESYERDEDTYAVLVCLGCKNKFIVKRDKYAPNKFDSWYVVFPLAKKQYSIDIPEPIKGQLEEASLAFSVGAIQACIAMCQIALESVWRANGVSDLTGLVTKGLISTGLKQQADEVRLWGNIVKHEVMPDSVTKEEVEQLLGYLASVLDVIYVQPKQFERLKQKRIERNKS